MRSLIPSSLIAVTALALGLVSCGGTQGPDKPQPGTPAFTWASAQDLITKGSFAEASNQLDKLTGKDGEFRDRAEALQIVLATGIAHGEMDWAEVWEDGSKYAREKHSDFKHSASSARTTAQQMVMRAAEITHKRVTPLKGTDLALVAVLPALSAELPVEAQRVKKGVALLPAEQAPALAKMQQFGVLKSFMLFTGAGKDAAKARDLLSKGDFKMPKDTFLLAIANQYLDLADIYAPKKLDQSGQVVMLCSEADAALALAAPSADVKALQKKVAALRAKAARMVPRRRVLARDR
jgi:hypothetical protein